MSQTKQLLDDLNKKVESLFSKLKNVEEESVLKTQEIDSLKTALKNKNESYDRLQVKLDQIGSVQPEAPKEDLKFKIDEMVKEIDRCISLLKV
ncbi:hypothetical protein [Crocinitomix catalasitica]|uniref:hypothetical protein n=1 Tax=Crocinitomix catalasitica TaxID=184607 RepID=UPI00048039BD|nr:hypothetical protein [Crocinitomix catalasitica]